MVLLRVGRHLAQTRRLAGEHINVIHLEVGTCLVRHGKQVEHGIRGAAHGDVQRHGVQECLAGGDAAREDTFIALFIIFIGIRYNQSRGIRKQFFPVLVGGDNRAVAREGKSDGFVQAVHGVGGEHA